MLVRPDMIFFLPLALLWLLGRRRYARPRRCCSACVLVVAPWTIRNARVHGRLILVACTGGVNFWTGNHPLATGEGDLAANPDIKRADLEFRAPRTRASAPRHSNRFTTAKPFATLRAILDGGWHWSRERASMSRSRSARRMRYTRPDIASRQWPRTCCCCHSR